MERFILAMALVAAAAVARADESVAAAPEPAPGRPPEIDPPIREGSLGHDSVCCTQCGWSESGRELGYCASGVFPDSPTYCESLAGGKKLSGRSDEKATRAVERRLEKLGFAHARGGNFSFADDLVITWRGDRDPAGSDLRVGAKLRGTDDAAWALTLHDRLGFATHPDAIALSPDGKTLGVVAHHYQGEWSNGYTLGTVSTAELAERAYNLAGLKFLKRGELAAAAALFKKAAAADPSSEKAAYNLACALARLAAPDTEAALARAVTVGGAAVKAKALRDPDFASVRNEAWFVALTKK